MNIPCILKTVAILSIFTALTKAEGLPIDQEADRILIPHVFVSLDANQQEEIAVLGSFTLRPEQWRELRQKFPSCPKRVASIFPKDWSDCLCGFEGGDYAIQWSKDSVALLTEGYEKRSGERLSQAVADGNSFSLSMDSRGQCYFEGSLVRFPEALQALERLQKSESELDVWLDVDIPFGMSRDAPALKSRLEKLEKRVMEAGWGFWAH